jgi:hypothetical protein
MPKPSLAPYERAIAEKLCRPCDQRDAEGHCCRGGDDPCVLRVHTEVLVDTITRLGRNRSPDEYGHALERRVCTVCPGDAKGYCSLDELLIDAPDGYLRKVADVILDAQDAERKVTADA